MLRTKAGRARDTMLALRALWKVRRMYRQGNSVVAEATSAAMRRTPASQEALDAAGIDAWQVARSVWRAKRWAPFRSTCLQTALATQMVFDRKGINTVVRVGVRATDADAHAWVEVGQFVLDDQRIAGRFSAFEVAAVAGQGGER